MAGSSDGGGVDENSKYFAMLGHAVRLQPQIDALFAQAGNPVPADLAPRIGALRLRRKRLASICMFVVLVVSTLGVQVWAPFPLWLTVLLVFATAVFTWRVYSSVTRYGWVQRSNKEQKSDTHRTAGHGGSPTGAGSHHRAGSQ